MMNESGSSDILLWGNQGDLTLPQVLSLSPWIVIVVFIAGGAGMFMWFEKKGL